MNLFRILSSNICNKSEILVKSVRNKPAVILKLRQMSSSPIQQNKVRHLLINFTNRQLVKFEQVGHLKGVVYNLLVETSRNKKITIHKTTK